MDKDMFLEQIKEMEEQLRDITGNPNASITVEKEGAKILYVPLAGAHTILPPAVVFSAAREDWTLSIFEASNYGVFLGDLNRAKQVANAAKHAGGRPLDRAQHGVHHIFDRLELAAFMQQQQNHGHCHQHQ